MRFALSMRFATFLALMAPVDSVSLTGGRPITRPWLQTTPSLTAESRAPPAAPTAPKTANQARIVRNPWLFPKSARTQPSKPVLTSSANRVLAPKPTPAGPLGFLSVIALCTTLACSPGVDQIDLGSIGARLADAPSAVARYELADHTKLGDRVRAALPAPPRPGERASVSLEQRTRTREGARSGDPLLRRARPRAVSAEALERVTERAEAKAALTRARTAAREKATAAAAAKAAERQRDAAAKAAEMKAAAKAKADAREKAAVTRAAERQRATVPEKEGGVSKAAALEEARAVARAAAEELEAALAAQEAANGLSSEVSEVTDVMAKEPESLEALTAVVGNAVQPETISLLPTPKASSTPALPASVPVEREASTANPWPYAAGLGVFAGGAVGFVLVDERRKQFVSAADEDEAPADAMDAVALVESDQAIDGVVVPRRITEVPASQDMAAPMVNEIPAAKSQGGMAKGPAKKKRSKRTKKQGKSKRARAKGRGNGGS